MMKIKRVNRKINVNKHDEDQAGKENAKISVNGWHRADPLHCLITKTYRRIRRIALVNWLVCECSTSKVTANWRVYLNKTYKKTTIFSKRIIFMHKSTSFSCLHTSLASEGVGEQRREWFILGKFIWIKTAKLFHNLKRKYNENSPRSIY